MTTKRWIDESSDADALERAVLSSGLEAEPPPGAERVIWRDLVAALPPVVPPAGVELTGPAAATAGATVKGAATLVTLAKGFAIGVGVSLAGAGAARLTERHAPDSRVESAPRAPVPGTTPATRGATPMLVPTPELPHAAPATNAPAPPLPASTQPNAAKPTSIEAFAPVLPAPASPLGAAPSRPTSSVAAFPVHASSRLEEEAAMLNRARAELHAGRLTQASATLEASRERFSAPELNQEREALTIELLYRSGQRAQAVTRAERFLAAHPESPHVAKIRSFVRP